MKQIEQIHQQKHFFLLLFLFTSFSIITLRLVQLQVMQHKKFAQYGEKNFVRFKTIPAQRGNILDCNHQALVTNQPVTNVVWQGTCKQALTEQQLTIIDTINRILHITIPVKQIKHAERFSKSYVIAEKISSQDLFYIAEQCSDTHNVTFETSYERYYPHKKLACHTIGYLSGGYLADTQTLMQGKMGLEKLFEDILKGEPGIHQQYINSFGTLLENKLVKHQSSGKDLVTTIDIRLQKIAELAMKGQQSGALIVLDPQTGRIPALVSLPNFDPTILSQKMSTEQWQQLQQTRPFINRAFNASYPPASIFKLITIAAALEQNLVDTESLFDCRGHVTFKKQKYFCNKHSGHGLISLKESLAYSCNIPCYEIAKRMPIDTLASYAFEFGLGNKTDALFAEQYGLVPTNEWKMVNKGERWWTGETLSASIGQSFLLATPIQIACMIGGIFHGYLVKPRILHNQDTVQTPINVKPETREFLLDCMKSVITTGTGRRINKFLDITIFAKTGTAQTIHRSKYKRSDGQNLHHAWFVSYFYTDTTQPLVLVILLEHVGSSRIATQVAKDFFAQYTKLLHTSNA
ncbi:MAG: penicillin-binding protein 2 [Epsilonproteobacteria bacterium]|nr:penicillin-binding protein 2 [Campylobacterota bacterium]